MFVGDVTHLEALDRSELMDLIWAFDFHLSVRGTWSVVIQQQLII